MDSLLQPTTGFGEVFKQASIITGRYLDFGKQKQKQQRQGRDWKTSGTTTHAFVVTTTIINI